MTDETALEDNISSESLGAGTTLREAREKLGLSQAQISAQTRIAERHVLSIEEGRFEDLPGRMYAVGFAKTIAKVVGLDQVEIGAMVREELGEEGTERELISDFEPGDPSRSPSKNLLWFSLLAAVLLAGGLFVAAKSLFWPSVELPSLIASDEGDSDEGEAEEAAGESADATPAGGAVVFTAQDAVWVRFYSEGGVRLKEGELAKGESYAIPSDAQGPMLISGRPDLLTIAIGGRAVSKISDEAVTVSDVPVSAKALLAREQETAGSDDDS